MRLVLSFLYFKIIVIAKFLCYVTGIKGFKKIQMILLKQDRFVFSKLLPYFLTPVALIFLTKKI
jgi:alpha-mannosidase